MFHRKTILIVDDEPVVRALLRVMLEPTDTRIVEAADGGEALEIAWNERPEVAIVDVGLPKLSGVDVCRALMTNPDPPVVLLITGNVYAEELDGCGAYDVFPKPFDPQELLEVVECCLGLVTI